MKHAPEYDNVLFVGIADTSCNSKLESMFREKLLKSKATRINSV